MRISKADYLKGNSINSAALGRSTVMDEDQGLSTHITLDLIMKTSTEDQP